MKIKSLYPVVFPVCDSTYVETKTPAHLTLKPQRARGRA